MKKLLTVLTVLCLAAVAGAQVYPNGHSPAAVTTCPDPLPLAKLTDSATANRVLLSGGGAGDPNYAALPLATITDSGTAGLCLISGGGGGDPSWTLLPLAGITDDGTAGKFLASGGGGGDPAWTSPTWVLLQGSTPGSAQTGHLNISGTLVCATAKAPAGAAASPGSALAIAGGAGGTAATDSDGQAGGAVSLTGGAGSALNGTGANDGSGGDLVLLGGAKGGATGTAVDGIVRVGSPSLDSTRTTDLLAVAGGLEVDGDSRFDEDATFSGSIIFPGTSHITDIYADDRTTPANGRAIRITAGYAGEPTVPGDDGYNGGYLAFTGGEGSAKDTTGTNDGSGGDLILLGGAKGGTNGTAVDGVVRVGSPTIGSAKTVDLLAVGGGLEVDGAARFDGGISAGASAGMSTVVTVRNDVGDGTCTMTFTSGLLTATTCTHT